MIDWFPIFFVSFKGLVLGIGMFYAVKWHYDKDRAGKDVDGRAVLRATGKVAAIFALALVGLWYLTVALMKAVGLDLTM